MNDVLTIAEAGKLYWCLATGGRLWHITKPDPKHLPHGVMGLCGARPKWGWDATGDPFTGPESAPPIERHWDHDGWLSPCQRCLTKAAR